MKKKSFALLVMPLLGVLSPALCAQAVFKSDPRAQKVIDEAVAALGGQRFLTMRNRVESGRAYSFYRNNISGLSIASIYTQYFEVPPDKTGADLGVRERQVFGKNEEFGFVLFREDGAWEVTFQGPRELEKDRLENYRRSTLNDILYILRMRLKEPGLTFDWKGSDVVENQPVDMVDVVDSEDRVVSVNFNKDSHLPVRETWVWHDPKDLYRNEEVVRYNLYRDDGKGIQWPQSISRESNGQKKYQIFSDWVLINQDLPDSMFDTPHGPATKVPWKPPKTKKK